MYVVVKILVSGLIIGFVTEIARRFPTYGGLLAALPLISILSIIWLTIQGGDAQHNNKFIIGVLMGLPATAVMLVVIHIVLKQSWHLSVAIVLGCVAWGLFLMCQKLALNFFGLAL
ncbi:DUF3147 family protein [Psychrobacillus sp.]|uniref:DUF3147 family protein n=1 Tax=Psychrobacillus sp. TaxID=1871623 RepID=UPI0028BE662B|nr:DUF3147 family protein [Psychrobacillus sp.]